jgi:hypothetical protein
MQAGRPNLPRRLFDRHYAKRWTQEAAAQIDMVLSFFLTAWRLLCTSSSLTFSLESGEYSKLAEESSWTSDI